MCVCLHVGGCVRVLVVKVVMVVMVVLVVAMIISILLMERFRNADLRRMKTF